jgi:peptide/nickel transport system substrate-binding protein
MEGEGSKPLPQESASTGGSTKLIVAIIVVILVVAAIAGALLLMGGGETTENKAPTASLTLSDNEVVFGQSVTFNGTGSSDPDGTIAKYIWQFGDGNSLQTVTNTVSYTYTIPGQFLAVLTVVDDKGMTGSSWASVPMVTVANPPVPVSSTGAPKPTNYTAPFAFAAVSTPLISTGAVVKFDGNSSFAYDWKTAKPAAGYQVQSLIWNFGDGAKTNGTYAKAGFVTHTYAGNGTMYTATLTVVSTYGAVQVYAVTIGVQPKGGSTPGGVTNPGTFTYATIGEARGLDPAVDYESAGGQILNNVYETLIAYDGNSTLKFKPMLATEVPSFENGQITSDGMHYTFNLRSGVKFHDGTSMTADDVVYSIRRVMVINDPTGPAWMLGSIMLPGYGSGKQNWDDINASVVKINNTAVQFNLIKPYPGFLAIMAYTIGSVVSKNYVEANGGVVPLTQNTWMNRHEMGTGPFSLKEWAPNQYIKMQGFANYWQGKPQLQYVVVKKVQDLGTREMLLFNGQADAIYVPVMFKQDVENKDGVFTQGMLPTFAINYMGMNQVIIPDSGVDIGDIPLTFFSDVNVRKAFVYAFDYTTYIREVTKGTAVVPNGPIPIGMPGYDPTVPSFNYDVTMAADYIKKALDTREGAAPGSTYADNGFNIVLYYNAGNLGREAGCKMVKSIWEQELSQNASLGITGKFTVDSRALDWPSMLDYYYANKMSVFFLGWQIDYNDPDDFVNPFCHQNGSCAVFESITNQSLTTLVEKAASELNADVRAQMYREISMSCFDNAYYLWTTQPTAFAVLKTWVHGWYYNAAFADTIGYFYPMSKS